MRSTTSRPRRTSRRRRRSPTRCSRARSRAADVSSGSTRSRSAAAGRRGRRGWREAVAAQALARTGSLLGDPQYTSDAARAYAAVPPLVMQTSWGQWIRLYGFSRLVVLNAQLQAILSLSDYGSTDGERRGDGAGAEARRGRAGALPALRHRRLVDLQPRRDVCAARLRAVRHAGARPARVADAGAVLGRRRAALQGVPRPAAGDGGDAAADALPAAAGRVPRQRVDPDHALAALVRHRLDREQGAHVPVRAAARTCSRGRPTRRSRRGPIPSRCPP